MTPVEQERFRNANHIFGGFVYPSPIVSIVNSENEVYLKRDDMLQLGCSKQRSLPLMIYSHLQKGETKFCVSSSGNAALVSAFCAMQASSIESMFIYLSSGISDSKLQKFVDYLDIDCDVQDLREEIFIIDNLKIQLVEDPRQEAFNQSKLGYVNLRGSTDDSALTGFASITDELVEQLGSDIDAVFVPASSGTTAQGIYQGFLNYGLKPQIHVVQTSKVKTLIKNLATQNQGVVELDHPSESIVDIIGHRKKQIQEIISDSMGYGWIIGSQEVAEAKAELEGYGIYTSFDSALAYAAYLKACAIESFKKPVLLLTG